MNLSGCFKYGALDRAHRKSLVQAARSPKSALQPVQTGGRGTSVIQHVMVATRQPSVDYKQQGFVAPTMHAQNPTYGNLARSDVVRYLFVVPEYISSLGQVLKVVGNETVLGNWNPQRAPTMQWCDGHRWKLDISLPKKPFEFKVVMMQNGEVCWEQGVNRVVQAEESEEHDAGEDWSSETVEIVVQVRCNFHQTEDTQLALMLPKADVKEARELALATLQLQDRRRIQLQDKLDKGEASTDRRLELEAMRDAMTEQACSVASLSDLIQAAGKEEHCSMPVARVHLPRGASVGKITQLAAATLHPNRTALAAGQKPSMALPAPARAPSVRPPSAQAPVKAETARELDSAYQRLQDFLQRHAASTNGSALSAGGVNAAATAAAPSAASAAPAGVQPAAAAQAEVRELASLMAEAEAACQQYYQFITTVSRRTAMA